MYHHQRQYPTQSSSSSIDSFMSVCGIQGQLLEVTVVGCNRLKDTEWISRQDPYVCVEYGSTKRRTRTCTDGGKNPVFQEKFVFSLIEGLRELDVKVWNSNTLKLDDFIGSGKIPLQKVLIQGFDDSTWPIQSKSGRHSGEVRLILHYPNAKIPVTHFSPTATPYAAPTATYPQGSTAYSAPSGYPSASSGYPSASSGYPSASSGYPSAYPSTNSAPYPPSTYPPSSAPYLPSAALYPPSVYPPHQPPAYPPSPSPFAPTSAYPPTYPPPPQASSHYPRGPFPGTYPPPPY